MQRGTVTYWNEKKRFGFIHPDDGGADVSYYPAGGAPDVEVGDRVEFEVLARTQVTPSGPIAIDVRILRGPEAASPLPR
jgi:cold shock CspA family protein